MFCTKCGSTVEEGAQFCTKCGQPTSVDDTDAREAERRAAEAAEVERLRMEEFGRKQQEAIELERERIRTGQTADATAQMVTPVAQVLDDGNMAYLAPEDPERVAATPEDEVKKAKAAYKDAKKAAGKSSAPKVIAIIVIVVVVAAAIAGGFWYMNQQSQAAIQEAQDQAAAAQAEADAANQRADDAEAAAADAAKSSASASSASSAAASSASSSASSSSASSDASAAGGIASYVGTWQGDLLEVTKYAAQARCYGAEGHPLVLEITESNATGSIKANAKVLFHDHPLLTGSDASSSEGDDYIEVKDLVGTLDSSGSFKFFREFPERGTNREIEISAKTVDKVDGTRTLEVTVDSKTNGGHATDSYILTRG